MKSKVSDKDVLQLLTSLKGTDSAYPQALIDSRKDSFKKQAAAMAILAKAGSSSATSTGASQTATSATAANTTAAASGVTMSTVLETALIIAIAAEASVATYIYRNKIADFFRSTFGPQVTQTAKQSSPSDTLAENTSTAETPSETPIVTETPLPPQYTPTTQIDTSKENDTQPMSASTPTPDDGNGLHLGQTKQPTSEPNKNNK